MKLNSAMVKNTIRHKQIDRWLLLIPAVLLCSCITRDARAPDREDSHLLIPCTVDGEAYIMEGWLRAPANSRAVPSGFVLFPEKAHADCAIEHHLVYSPGSFVSYGKRPPIVPWVDWIAITNGPLFEARKGTVYLVSRREKSWVISILIDQVPAELDEEGLTEAVAGLKAVRVVFSKRETPKQSPRPSAASAPAAK